MKKTRKAVDSTQTVSREIFSVSSVSSMGKGERELNVEVAEVFVRRRAHDLVCDFAAFLVDKAADEGLREDAGLCEERVIYFQAVECFAQAPRCMRDLREFGGFHFVQVHVCVFPRIDLVFDAIETRE